MSKILQTERLILRSASEDDAETLSRWKSSFLLRENSVGLDTKINPHNQRIDVRNSLMSGDLYLIIELKDTETPIGYIRLGWLDDCHSRCWLSYGMGSHYRKGYCYEALNKLLTSVYKYNMVNIINAEVFDFNIASKNLLDKLHFENTGISNQTYYYLGRNWDILKYKLTPDIMKNYI